MKRRRARRAHARCIAQAVAHVRAAYVAPFPDAHFSLITLGPAAPTS